MIKNKIITYTRQLHSVVKAAKALTGGRGPWTVKNTPEMLLPSDFLKEGHLKWRPLQWLLIKNRNISSRGEDLFLGGRNQEVPNRVYLTALHSRSTISKLTTTIQGKLISITRKRLSKRKRLARKHNVRLEMKNRSVLEGTKGHERNSI